MPGLHIPDSLDWVRRADEGPEWLISLPEVVAECEERWRVTVGEPYPDGYTSIAMPAGPDAVLKVQFPHDESEHEAEALRVWDGDGAVRLLDHDSERNALLIERCHPGDHLSTIPPGEALSVLVGLLPRLLKPAGSPFRALDDEARQWIESIPHQWERAGRPFEESLIRAAVDGLNGVLDWDGDAVLLHQDLHGDNVLAAQREPWLAIDPKPLVGDPAFSVAPIVRSYEFGHSGEQVWQRFDHLTSELGLDRDRAWAWTVGQTIAWAFEGERAIQRHIETARWLVNS